MKAGSHFRSNALCTTASLDGVSKTINLQKIKQGEGAGRNVKVRDDNAPDSLRDSSFEVKFACL